MDKKRELKLTETKLSFFTNISHEFKTPLTLIISPLQELLNNYDIKAEISSKLITAEKNANKLLNLINELLDFRKADHGLLKIKVVNGDFTNFSKEIFLLFSELAKSKKIEYHFHSKQEVINFPFDRNKMEIVLSNLISNALKFTPDGGKIDVYVKSINGFCICTIKDTGIGIPINDIDKVFDEFYMVKREINSNTVGTGIGLFLSKKIIELHHGQIDVLSEYGIGTEIIASINMDPANYREIDLNFKKSEDISSYKHNEDSLDLTNLNIESKETLLIIDDNKDIRTYLRSLLSNEYHILEAENGDLGCIAATQKMPDLIISDIMMPVKDGITLCSELKNNLSTSHIPIILLTARNSTLFEISGLESGADDYITKPFNANIVKARIKSLLDNRTSTRKHLLNKVRFEPIIEVNDKDIEIGFIEKAITLVEENIQNTNFGIDKMTDYFCMSQSTLYRKIKSLTGLSLTAFIRSIRLKQAAFLISTTDTKLSYICYEVGFNDYKYFRTSFKQQFNCLPSKYKNSKILSEISDI
jgi:DNA-binding response OmpR family regulator